MTLLIFSCVGLALSVLITVFCVPLGIVFLIFFGIFLAVSISKMQDTKFKAKFNIPKVARKIRYFKGYDKPLHKKLFYSADLANNTLTFWDSKMFKEQQEPTKIFITKDDVTAFTTVGDLLQTTQTKGGPNLGGALVGGALAGGLGAVVGGSKRKKTTTVTTDTRQTILKFNEDGKEKGMLLEYFIYKDLCMNFTDKQN